MKSPIIAMLFSFAIVVSSTEDETCPTLPTMAKGPQVAYHLERFGR
jgi:hypothetical protein